MIKTSHGNGMFSADVVYLCAEHGIQCKVPNCPNYKRFTEGESFGQGKAFPLGSLNKALPSGTQVNFIGRAIGSSAGAGPGDARFQATLVWPQLSKKPIKPDIPSEAELDEHLQVRLRRFPMQLI